MVDLDLKDRKILYELDLNCRQSNTQIGKKVGLSRKVVEYRIKKMENDGIITGYSTLVNIFKLGYQVYRIYLKLQDIPPDIKKQLINEFVNYKKIWVVYSTVGQFDIGSIFFVDNVNEFYNFYNNLLNCYGKYLNDKNISIIVKAEEYEKSYLISDKKSSNTRRSYKLVSDGRFYQIDELDYNILNEIVLNAKIPLIELADKLNSSSQTINLRIKNLIKNEIIKTFRVDIDFSKLGLKYFYIQITLRDNTKRKDIIDYVKFLHSFKCLNTAIGYTELDIEFIYESMDQMNDLLDEIENKFPNAIRKYFFHKARENYIERWLPEMTEKDFKK